jgi:hypothetical protein
MEAAALRRGRPGLALFAFSAALILSFPAAAGADDSLSFGGYFKSFAILVVPPSLVAGASTLHQPALAALDNRLRLELTGKPSKSLSFDIAYDFSPRLQSERLFEQALLPTGQGLGGYRLADLRNRLYPGPDRTPENFAVYQNLDRLTITVKTSFADISFGRQAIAWGSARLINPTDILAPFAFDELDKEERTGVDAVRVRVPLGSLDELDLGLVAGDRFEAGTSAAYLRGKVHVLKTDLAALVMDFRRHLLLGLDVSRSIGGAGAYLDAAFVVPDAFLKGAAGARDYFRVSAGADYTFTSELSGFAEYHFSSAGAARPADYLSLPGTVPFRDGAVYLLGRHYLSLGSTWQITPLLPFTGLVIANLGDGSVVLAPSLDYSLSENADLGAGAYLGIGRRPEIVGAAPAPPFQPNLLRSEFGSYPDLVYLSFRVYF